MTDGTDEVVDDVSIHDSHPIPDDIMVVSTTVLKQTDHVVEGGALAEPAQM
jgi:hypothetical protein